MYRGRGPTLFCAVAISFLIAAPHLHAASPSLCLSIEEGCNVLDGTLRVRIQLGATDSRVVSGQFSIQYDPARLDFAYITPGQTCDPTSPFNTELFEVVDESTGVIHYGTSIELGGAGTHGPALVACATFKIIAGVPGNVCLFNGPNPYETRLSNEMGFPVFINNAIACPTANPAPSYSCDSYVTSLNCVCPNGIAPDCSLLTDQCHTGYCDGFPGQCLSFPQDAGSCNDNNPCTHPDKCDNGYCIGTNCPDPSLCVIGEEGCHVPGSVVRYKVQLGSGEPIITSGQFTLMYDPAALDFLSIAPGDNCDVTSPFTNEIFENVDENQGKISYAVGIAPGIGVGTSGPATMACVTFMALGGTSTDLCMVSADNPFETRLSDDMGNSVTPDNGDTCHPYRPPPALSCASTIFDDTCNCPLGPPDCSRFTNSCNEGVCIDMPAHCQAMPDNEGQGCDDGYACSANESCVSGTCMATDCNNPSLCVNGGSSCPTIGGLYQVSIIVGSGDDVIVSGEFSLHYNPLALDFVSIAPGGGCDPTSPFDSEIFEFVNEATGDIHYAAGVDISSGGVGTMGPAALACLTFIVLKDTESNVCLFQDENPLITALVNDQGESIEIYNAVDCPLPQPSTDLSCLNIDVIDSCECPGGTADCTHLSDDCNLGFCDGPPYRCQSMSINEGGQCNDGNPCTTIDTCTNGVCMGTGCTSPSLCVLTEETCQVPSTKLVRIVIGEGDPYIVGGSFMMNFDPSIVSFISIEPGATCDPLSPFVLEVYEDVDLVTGSIFYAVGVDPGMENPGTQGPATLACLNIQLNAVDLDSSICISTGTNPSYTLLADRNGFSIPVDNTKDCVEPLLGDSLLSCDHVCKPVPTTTTWGTIILTLLLLVAARLRITARPI